MNKLVSYLVTLIGILLVLPLLSVNLGIASSWIIAIAVLIIGIVGITEK